MSSIIYSTIVRELFEELVVLNEIRLKIAYGQLYKTKNNKSLAATRLNNLLEQED